MEGRAGACQQDLTTQVMCVARPCEALTKHPQTMQAGTALMPWLLLSLQPLLPCQSEASHHLIKSTRTAPVDRGTHIGFKALETYSHKRSTAYLDCAELPSPIIARRPFLAGRDGLAETYCSIDILPSTPSRMSRPSDPFHLRQACKKVLLGISAEVNQPA